MPVPEKDQKDEMHASYFADQLRLLASLDYTPETERTLDAFRSVVREKFAGGGPWKVHSALADVSQPPQITPSADPRWLYHSVLIVLDETKGINIGDPSLWAGVLARSDIQPGARLLQVGVGVGYYTAILSELVGPTGQVIAYEVEKHLVERACKNLAEYTNVEVRHGNAATDLAGEERFDVVVSFAGVTHIPQIWVEHLAPNAKLLLPLTGVDWWGAMILAQQSDDGFEAITLGKCGFYPCAGARDEGLAVQISDVFSNAEHLRDWKLKIFNDGYKVHIEPAKKTSA